MKKIISLLFVILFAIAAFPQSAIAAEKEVSIASAYCSYNNLYAFVKLDKEKIESPYSVKLELKRNATSYGSKSCSTRIRYSEVEVTYMLLVDLSTSMAKYKSYISAFAESLLDSTTNETKVIIASLGEKYDLIADDLTDKDKIKSTINNLSFTQTKTDVLSGIDGAIDHLSEKKPENGELINLIVLTDGITYSADDSAEKVEETKNKIIATPEFVVSSVSFADFDNAIAEALSTVSGNNFAAGDYSATKTAGSNIADYVGDLYMLEYPFAPDNSEEEYKISFSVSSTSDSSLSMLLSLSGVKNFDYDAKAIATTSAAEPETETTETTTATTTEKATQKVTEKEKKSEPEKNDNTKIIILSSAIAAVILICIILIAIIAKKRKNNKGDNNIIPETSVEFEVLSGGISDKYSLKNDRLTFGSTDASDVMINDNGQFVNAAITNKDGQYYIENLSDVSNVSVNGMKIYSENLIGPNDVIQIGTACFKIKY